MAVGDLEGKIGEISGQLKTLAPILEQLGTKLNDTREKLVAQKENLKQVWVEINALKTAQATASAGAQKRWWDVWKILLAAIVGGAVTFGLTKIH